MKIIKFFIIAFIFVFSCKGMDEPSSELMPLNDRISVNSYDIEYFYGYNFKTLYDHYTSKNLPFIIAKVQFSEKQKTQEIFCDALELNRHLFGQNFLFPKINRYELYKAEKKCMVLQKNKDIEKMIKYYIYLNKNENGDRMYFNYLGDDWDLHVDEVKDIQKIFYKFFESNLEASIIKILDTDPTNFYRFFEIFIFKIDRSKWKKICELVISHPKALPNAVFKAEYFLAESLYCKQGIKRLFEDSKKAWQILTHIVMNQDKANPYDVIRSKFILGQIYYYGDEIEKNLEIAEKYFQEVQQSDLKVGFDGKPAQETAKEFLEKIEEN